MGVAPPPLEKMWGITYAVYPLQVGLPLARGAELATIQKDVTTLHPLPIPLRQKNTKFVVTTWVLSSSYPTSGAYDAPPDPLVGWGGGHLLPIALPSRRLRRLHLAAILPFF